MSKKALVWSWSIGIVALIVILTIVYQIGHNATNNSDQISSVADNQVIATTSQSDQVVDRAVPVTKKVSEKTQPNNPVSQTSADTQKTQAVVQPTQTVQAPVTPVAINYSSYPKLYINQYDKNPQQYLGSGVKLAGGIVNDFLPAGGRGGAYNFIELEDGTSPGLEKVEVKFSNSDYQSVVSLINKGDFINVYGLGSNSLTFTSSNAYGSHNTSMAVVSGQRVDKCEPYDCTDGHTTTVFSK